MPFPLAAALGLGSAVVGLFSKNKKQKMTYNLSPEDLKRRNAWLQRLQAKTQRPNLANQQFGQNMGLLNSLYRRNQPRPMAGPGPNPGPQPQPQFGPGPVRPNPYLGMFGRQ